MMMLLLLLLLLHNVASDFQKLFPNASSKLQLSLKGKENWAEAGEAVDLHMIIFRHLLSS